MQAEQKKLPFLQAAASGQTVRCETLLDLGVDVDARDGKGLTALHLAALGGFSDTVAVLLSRGADADAVCTSLGTPLCPAAVNGDLNTVLTLLSARSDPNAAGGALGSPLHIACFFHHVEVVKALLSDHAKPNNKLQMSEQSLRHVQSTPVKELISPPPPLDRLSITLNAQRQNRSDSGPGTRKPSTGAPRVQSTNQGQLQQRPEAVRQANQAKPITQAALSGQAEQLQSTGASETVADGIEAGPNPRPAAGDKDGDIRLKTQFAGDKGTKASQSSSQADTIGTQTHLNTESNVSVTKLDEQALQVQFKTGQDAEKQAKPEINDKDAAMAGIMIAGASVLAAGAVAGGAFAANAAKKSGNRIFKDAYDEVTEAPCTPLLVAVACGQPGLIPLLLDSGAEVTTKTILGQTPLHIAACYNLQPCLDELLAAGFDVNAPGRRQQTALMYAAGAGHTDSMRQLLDAKADPNAQCEKSKTALSFAAAAGRKEAVELLLERGGDYAVKDYKNRIPEFYAKRKDQHECRAVLEQVRVAKEGDANNIERSKLTEAFDTVAESAQAQWSAIVWRVGRKKS